MIHLTEKPAELAARALQYSSLPGARLSAAPPSVLPDGRLLRRGWGQAGGWAGCRTPLPLPPRVRQPVRQPVLARSVPQREQRRQHLAQVGERVDAEVFAPAPDESVEEGLAGGIADPTGFWRATPRSARRTSRSRAASSVPGMRRSWKSEGNGQNHLPGNALPPGTGRTAAEGRSGGCSRQEAACCLNTMWRPKVS